MGENVFIRICLPALCILSVLSSFAQDLPIACLERYPGNEWVDITGFDPCSKKTSPEVNCTAKTDSLVS